MQPAFERAAAYTEKARKECEELGQFTLTDNYKEADIAVLFLHPKSGNYFNATPGLLELEVCEKKTLTALDGTTYEETALSNMGHFKAITENIHSRGGKVMTSVNVIMPWILGNIEPLSDALIAGYDTYYHAQFEVIAGNIEPVGVLPLTLPASDEVIAVDKDGNCRSRNDVPGYDKDMPEGLTNAYEDQDGNVYRLAMD